MPTDSDTSLLRQIEGLLSDQTGQVNLPGRRGPAGWVVVEPDPSGTTAPRDPVKAELVKDVKPPSAKVVVVEPDPPSPDLESSPLEPKGPPLVVVEPDPPSKDSQAKSLQSEKAPLGEAKANPAYWQQMLRSSIAGGTLIVVLLAGLLIWLEPLLAAGLAGYLGGRLARTPWNGLLAALSPLIALRLLGLIAAGLLPPIFASWHWPTAGALSIVAGGLTQGLVVVREPLSPLFVALLSMGFVGGLAEWLRRHKDLEADPTGDPTV